MKLTFLAAALLSCAISARAQITGTVLEDATTPAFYANVVLARAADTAFVAGAVTDEAGAFAIEVPAEETVTAGFSVSENGAYDAGTLTLGAGATTELSTAAVTARRQLIRREIDRTVVDVSADVTALGQTALEVLERAPGVFVDRGSGALQMLGKDGVNVMIIGRLNYMPTDALLAFLAGPRSGVAPDALLLTERNNWSHL